MPINDSTEPTWSTDTNFASGLRVGSPTKVEPSSGELAQGFVPHPTRGFMSGFANHVLHKIAT